jgi:hypothetical protein
LNPQSYHSAFRISSTRNEGACFGCNDLQFMTLISQETNFNAQFKSCSPMAGHGSDVLVRTWCSWLTPICCSRSLNGNQTLNPRRHRAERDGSLEHHTSKGPQPVKESMLQSRCDGTRFITNEHRDNSYHRRSYSLIWGRRRLLVFKTEVIL